MLFEDFLNTFILNDGCVLRLSCDFERKETGVRLSVRKWLGKKIEPCIMDVIFTDAIEIDLLDTFGLEYYTDFVFVKTEAGDFYASFDPFGNSGRPNENDNFVIKSKEVWVKTADGDFKLE